MPLSVSIRLFSGIDFGVCDVTSIAVDSKGHVLVGQEAHEYTRTHEREELGKGNRLQRSLNCLHTHVHTLHRPQAPLQGSLKAGADGRH